MRMTIAEATRLLQSPKQSRLEIKQWDGYIELCSITVSDYSELLNIKDNSCLRRKLLLKTIKNPVINEENIGILLKHSYTIIEYIFEAALLISCLHPKTEIAIRETLNTNDHLYNKFMLGYDTKIPVWSYGKPIDEWYILEYYFWVYYQIVSRERSQKGAIKGRGFEGIGGKDKIITKLISKGTK